MYLHRRNLIPAHRNILRPKVPQGLEANMEKTGPYLRGHASIVWQSEPIGTRIRALVMEARPTFEFPWVLLYKNNKTVGGLDKKQLTKVRETLPAPEVEA